MATTSIKSVFAKRSFSQVRETILPTIPLYRQLLRAHRRLPIEMRSLGDAYIKTEFRLHSKTTNPLQIVGFLSEWKKYLDSLPKDPNESEKWKGRKLDSAAVEKMNPEQVVQLSELMDAAKEVWKDPSTEGETTTGKGRN